MPKIETVEVCRGDDGKFAPMNVCCPESTGCCTSGQSENTHESQLEVAETSTGPGLDSFFEPLLEIGLSALNLMGSWLTAKYGLSDENHDPYDPDDLTKNP